MTNLWKIAGRNLLRYKRRTLLTLSLIVFGVLFVAVFEAVTGSFKGMMIGQITDSFLGHMQIHRKGYLAAIESLPLTMNLKPQAVRKMERILKDVPEIEAWSPRIKFGGMFSNFVETTNIRINGVDPEKESRTVPLFFSRIVEGEKALHKGDILVPELLAKGLKVKVGDAVVVIATNRDGSVNGKQLRVGGILESVTGPGGRDGYLHMDDAMEILRMEEQEISEVALRLKDFGMLQEVHGRLSTLLGEEKNPQGQPVFDVNTWEKLSPFYNIASMIDIMTLFIKLMLIAIVLISIMNVMIMAVYERVREIGTMAAIGTLPRKILALFVLEGFSMGIVGAIIGSLLSSGAIYAIHAARISFDFGRQTGLILAPTMDPVALMTISGIVIGVSILASLQPALKAARMDPIEALGHV
ncbi:MAG: putative transport system permease protein [Thermodesulfobacteriota bacterium]|nr:putative transport system permease protein [Thermodesulfobacteriota bacterium]